MPTMTAFTRSQPNPSLTEEQKKATATLIAEMTAAGKTNGVRFAIVEGFAPGKPVPDSLIIRPFATLADAHEWGAFITTTGSTNISYFSIVE